MSNDVEIYKRVSAAFNKAQVALDEAATAYVDEQDIRAIVKLGELRLLVRLLVTLIEESQHETQQQKHC